MAKVEPLRPVAFSADSIFTLQDVRQFLGLGVSALRMARRNGLIVRRVGRRSFVLGDELVDYIRRHGKVIT